MNYMEHAANYMGWPAYAETLEAAIRAPKVIGDVGRYVLSEEAEYDYKEFAFEKRKNIGAVMFGVRHCLGQKCLQRAVIIGADGMGHFGLSEEHELKPWEVVDKAIGAVLMDEFYFGRNLNICKKMLKPFANAAKVAGMLEEETAIEGLGNALLS